MDYVTSGNRSINSVIGKSIPPPPLVTIINQSINLSINEKNQSDNTSIHTTTLQQFVCSRKSVFRWQTFPVLRSICS